MITYNNILNNKFIKSIWKFLFCRTIRVHLFNYIYNECNNHFYCDACGLIIDINRNGKTIIDIFSKNLDKDELKKYNKDERSAVPGLAENELIKSAEDFYIQNQETIRKWQNAVRKMRSSKYK